LDEERNLGNEKSIEMVWQDDVNREMWLAKTKQRIFSQSRKEREAFAEK